MSDLNADMDFSGGGGEGGRQIRLPRKTINQEYFIGALYVMGKMDTVLATLTRIDDPRPRLLARQIINRILDDDIKYKMLDEFDRLMKEIDESPLTEDAKAAKRLEISQDAVGEVNSYWDEFLALHKGQVIGEV